VSDYNDIYDYNDYDDYNDMFYKRGCSNDTLRTLQKITKSEWPAARDGSGDFSAFHVAPRKWPSTTSQTSTTITAGYGNILSPTSGRAARKGEGEHGPVKKPKSC
jgi:hypothetical protein